MMGGHNEIGLSFDFNDAGYQQVQNQHLDPPLVNRQMAFSDDLGSEASTSLSDTQPSPTVAYLHLFSLTDELGHDFQHLSSHELTIGEYILGRKASTDIQTIQITKSIEQGVSAKHCRIEIEAPLRVFVYDLESTNGTSVYLSMVNTRLDPTSFVSAVSDSPTALVHGSVFKMGAVYGLFVLSPEILALMHEGLEKFVDALPGDQKDTVRLMMHHNPTSGRSSPEMYSTARSLRDAAQGVVNGTNAGISKEVLEAALAETQVSGIPLPMAENPDLDRIVKDSLPDQTSTNIKGIIHAPSPSKLDDDPIQPSMDLLSNNVMMDVDQEQNENNDPDSENFEQKFVVTSSPQLTHSNPLASPIFTVPGLDMEMDLSEDLSNNIIHQDNNKLVVKDVNSHMSNGVTLKDNHKEAFAVEEDHTPLDNTFLTNARCQEVTARDSPVLASATRSESRRVIVPTAVESEVVSLLQTRKMSVNDEDVRDEEPVDNVVEKVSKAKTAKPTKKDKLAAAKKATATAAASKTDAIENQPPPDFPDRGRRRKRSEEPPAVPIKSLEPIVPEAVVEVAADVSARESQDRKVRFSPDTKHGETFHLVEEAGSKKPTTAKKSDTTLLAAKRKVNKRTIEFDTKVDPETVIPVPSELKPKPKVAKKKIDVIKDTKVFEEPTVDDPQPPIVKSATAAKSQPKTKTLKRKSKDVHVPAEPIQQENQETLNEPVFNNDNDNDPPKKKQRKKKNLAETVVVEEIQPEIAQVEPEIKRTSKLSKAQEAKALKTKELPKALPIAKQPAAEVEPPFKEKKPKASKAKEPETLETEETVKATLKKTRSSSRAASPVSTSRSSPPNIMFSGLSVLQKDQKLITSLGGTLTDDLTDCTLLITDKVRRTVKFMCAVASGKDVVTKSWLEECKKMKRWVDTEPYLLKDIEAEEKFQFDLVRTLKLTKAEKPLHGKHVYVTSNVKPPKSDMKDIVISAGGKFLESPPDRHEANLLIIGSIEDGHQVEELQKKGCRVHDPELLLGGLLKGKIHTKDYIIPTQSFILSKKKTAK